ncbi:MAG: MBOAT family protein [Lachnospiraceae bacterium]|nr:MBOAT family protein [Lachnospiraceae bacterium]MDE7202394.1 MBOAT family protein [Lachnospiraceae bacterium]
MVFNSYSFLIFFPIVVLVHFVLPKKVQHIWLLVASYYFYMNWDARYVLLLLFSTAVTYLSGIVMESVQTDRQRKAAVAVSFVLNIGVLFFFKYFNFAIDSVNLALGHIGLVVPKPDFNVLLPVGISFYTFQALSYTMDVYRKDITAERNFFRYALFVSFFPQLVAGPIERSKNLLGQVNQSHRFDYDKMRDGLLVMLWGYFLKLVVADRVAIVVNTVYGDYEQYGGVYIIVASVLFAVQIYCDFAGYSTIAIGAARILGFQLMENFDCPYFSLSIGEFWRRWHISLSSWFRDYLYIPLGGNRRGRIIKYRNLIIVFLVSGLWHGAAGTYVVWGLIHGIYQVIGSITKPVRDKINKALELKPDSIGHKLASGIVTFCLVDFAWIFFRAESIKAAISMISSMIHIGNIGILANGGLYDLGLNSKNFKILLLGIAVIIFADYMKYKGIKIREVILAQELWCRWMCYLAAFWFILIFGVWGGNYDASSFIYFQF